MHRTAAEFDPGVDEFDAVGLEKGPCEAVRPPRVKGAPIAMECRVERIITIGDLDDHVVFGEVVRFHIRDDIHLDRGRIGTNALPAVARLAAEYTVVENAFTTPLDGGILGARHGRRVSRLDARPTDWSPIDGDAWSPSGSVRS
ncbi:MULTISPECIES: flavin reductase family protein [unclassified Streptomyces]|uniref:flavin reductase family protein n=1 Tax=unclassified Streptomyces TaxID=2593676 RepID=UPI0038148DFF